MWAQPISARDRLEAATGQIWTHYHSTPPSSCDPSASTPPECSTLAADHYALVVACIDELGARHVTRRPWQLLRATCVIVRTPFPVSYGCADRDWPEIGVYHTRAHLQSHRQCWCSVCKGRFHSLECAHRLRATAIGISLPCQFFADRRTRKQLSETRGSSGTCQRRDPATAAPQCCSRLPASSISKARSVLRS